MAPTLYQTDMSPPCRAVRTVAKMIGVDLELKETSLVKGDQHKPEFQKLNPNLTIPVLKDGDLVLNESRAICTYLVNKYAPDNDHMYPKDPARRATVDCFLQFDLGTFYPTVAGYYYPVYLKGAKDFDEAAMVPLKKAVNYLELKLGSHKFLMGDHPSVADISIGTSITSLDAVGFDMSDYPKVRAFYARFKALPAYAEIQHQGVEDFRAIIIQTDAKRA